MKSFKFAFTGIFRTIMDERSMRIHLTVALYVIIAGFVCGISAAEWTAVIICMGVVTALECLNTALESLCDAVCPEENEGIMRCKDAAAGAVLCAAIASAVVGGVIFFNAERWNAAVDFLKTQTVWAVIIILILIPLAFFIRGKRSKK